MAYKSDSVVVRVQGPLACFTQPEFRTERMSGVIASHAGWEGILCSVMGHKGTWFQVEQVSLLFFPRWMSITQNEIRDFGSGKKPIQVEQVRTLRTTSMLCGNVRPKVDLEGNRHPKQTVSGVDYLVQFHLEGDDRNDLSTNWRMLMEDRLGVKLHPHTGAVTEERKRTDPDEEQVRYFRQPALGLRELICEVDPVIGEALQGHVAENYNQNLGLSYYGRDWRDESNGFPHYFADLTIRKGTCVYPSWEHVRRHGIRRHVKAA